MPIPRRVVDALKKVPGLRESRYVLQVAGRATGNALHHRFTGKTYEAKRLEREFQEKPDPWNFETSPAVIERCQKAWELLPQRLYRRILDVGCAEGHFTEQIVTRFPGAEVLALDFIPLALERAKARCGDRPNLKFQAIDIGKQGIPGVFDLIFCMGVLEEYRPTLGDLDTIRDRILGALAPGGYLLLETQRVTPEFENRWWARRLAWGARALHDRFRVGDVVLVAEALIWDNQRMVTLLQKMARSGGLDSSSNA